MASTITTATFLGASAAGKQLLPTTPSRVVVTVRASMEPQKIVAKEERNNTRRDLMFAMVAAAACSAAKVAMADEPKRGTADARKKYAPVCVTMPTARICYK